MIGVGTFNMKVIVYDIFLLTTLFTLKPRPVPSLKMGHIQIKRSSLWILRGPHGVKTGKLMIESDLLYPEFQQAYCAKHDDPKNDLLF